MAKIRICKEVECNDAATTDGYCRLHYLKKWKQIKDANRAKAARKLNNYIERICRENPGDYMDVIRRDLEKPDFEDSVVQALDFDEGARMPFSEDDDRDEEIERVIKKLKIEEGF